MTDLPNEQWRQVEGYDGKYLISDMGRCKSLKGKQPRYLTAFANNKGYYRVCLSHRGKAKHYLVSRLVAMAFCDNDDPQNKTTIDHIDGDKANNRASNLRWMSLKENVRKEWNAYERDGENDESTAAIE